MISSVFIYLIPSAFISFLAFFLSARQTKKLDSGSKAALFDNYLFIRKISSGSLLVVLSIFGICSLYFELMQLVIPFMIVMILMSISLSTISYRRIKKSNLPEEYLKNSRKNKIFLFSVIFIILSFYLFSVYRQVTNEPHLEIKAYKELEDKHYKKAIRIYDQLLKENNTNVDNLVNRAYCRYSIGDHKGAVNDWKKAQKLGSKVAKENLKMFAN